MILDDSGNALADVPVYGIGSGPQITFHPGTRNAVSDAMEEIVARKL